jgi:hypothetical protein
VKVETTSGNGSTSESQADDPGSDPRDEESPEVDPLASVPVGPVTIPPCFNAEAIISPSFGTHGSRARNDSPDPMASMLGNASVATARSFMSNESRYYDEDEVCRGARLKRNFHLVFIVIVFLSSIVCVINNELLFSRSFPHGASKFFGIPSPRSLPRTQRLWD